MREQAGPVRTRGSRIRCLIKEGQGEPKDKGLEEFVGEQEDYEDKARVLD